MLRRRLVLIVQSCVSIGLLSYLLSRIGVATAGRAILKADPILLAAGTVQLFAQPVLGSVRWSLVVRSLGGELTFPASIRLVWIGTFFNQALPGSVGGDVVRMWLYWRQGAQRELAIASVVLERILMIFGLLLLVLAVQPGLAARGAAPSIVIATGVTLAFALAGFASLAGSARFLAKLDQWIAFRVLFRLAAAVRRQLSHGGHTAFVLLISLVAYLNMAMAVWLLALGLDLSVSLADCVVLVPVAVLAAILPISIGGWGVRESVMIAVFALVGVPKHDGLALSVLFGLSGILVSLPGAVLWMHQHLHRESVTISSADGMLE